jgi:hypothetical protein
MEEDEKNTGQQRNKKKFLELIATYTKDATILQETEQEVKAKAKLLGITDAHL